MGGCFSRKQVQYVDKIEHFEVNPVAEENIFQRVSRLFQEEDIWAERAPIDNQLILQLTEQSERVVAQAKEISNRIASLTNNPSEALCESEREGLIESMHDI